jgi:HSP20 family protein
MQNPNRSEPNHHHILPWTPDFDVKLTQSECCILIDLPGIDEDGVEIDFQDSCALISGTREFEHDLEDAEEFLTIGRPYGRFRLQIPLCASVMANHATARYKRGVLKVRVPVRRSHPLGDEGEPLSARPKH